MFPVLWFITWPRNLCATTHSSEPNVIMRPEKVKLDQCFFYFPLELCGSQTLNVFIIIIINFVLYTWFHLQLCGAWDSSLWAEDMVSGEADDMILANDLDFTSHNSSPVRRRAQQRPTRVRGALNRSCSVPDSNNPPSISHPTHGDISVPVSDLTEIGADEQSSCNAAWSNRFPRLDRGWSCDSYPHSSSEGYMNSENQATDVNYDPVETLCGRETNIQQESDSEPCLRRLVSPSTSCQDLEQNQDSSEDQKPLNHSLYIPNNHMTKSMLCLNEESQDEVSWSQTVLASTQCLRYKAGELAVASRINCEVERLKYKKAFEVWS